MKKFSCIIPFYNEGQNVLNVIQEINNIPYFLEIICVDDGSSDNTSSVIKSKFPKVLLLRSEKNKGKANAVFMGLGKAKSNNIFLLDADSKNVKRNEIAKACKVWEKGNIDMLILKTRGPNVLIDNALKKFVFLSGNRIIKKENLLKVEKYQPKNYQLEVAINSFMRKNRKQIFWIDSSIYNPHKVKKLGLVKGILKEIAMEKEIFTYISVFEYIKQVIFLSKNKIA